MGVLSWGKPTIGYKETGSSGTTYTNVDTPKQDTTKMTTTSGSVTEAKEEGGEVIDTRYDNPTHQLEWDMFVKAGTTTFPFDGLKAGNASKNYEIKVDPEAVGCYGIKMPKCTVSAEITYSSADGILVHYIAKALKPDTGSTLDLVKKTS